MSGDHALCDEDTIDLAQRALSLALFDLARETRALEPDDGRRALKVIDDHTAALVEIRRGLVAEYGEAPFDQDEEW